MIPATPGHRPDCICNECEQRRIPATRAAYKAQERCNDLYYCEQSIRRAEAEYEARIYGERK